MKGLHKKLNDILIVFKLPEFSRSCSKQIGNIFQLSQPMIKLPMESFEIFIRKLFIKTLLWFERNVKRKLNKFWTFVLTCYTWNTVNTNSRMKYFFWYCINTTVRKFNNFNIGTVNVIQKKIVYLHGRAHF